MIPNIYCSKYSDCKFDINVKPSILALVVAVKEQIMLLVKKRRIRKVIHQLIVIHKYSDWVVPGLKQVTNGNYSWWFRGLWLGIVLVSLSACCYQTYARIAYYFTYPMAVNVDLETNFTFPSVTVCTQDTDAILEVKSKFSQNVAACLNQLLFVMKNVENVSVDEIWKWTDMTTLVSTFALEKDMKKSESLADPTNTYTPMGTCKTFYQNIAISNPSTVRMILKIKRPKMPCDYSRITGSVHEPFQKTSDMRHLFNFASLQTMHVYLTYVQYNYLNRTKSPCVNFDSYQKCKSKCYLKVYKNKNITCRFPFMPEELNLPFCISGPNSIVEEEYRKSLDIFLRSDAHRDCNCPRNCKKIVYDFGLLNTAMNQNESSFYFKLRDSYVTTVSEYYSFNVISLFCEIGGNIGLYFGLSVLAITQFVQSIVLYSFKKFQLIEENGLISQRINCILKRRLKKIQKFRGSTNKLHLLVLSICVIVAIYQVIDRMLLYWAEPTRIIIEVVEKEEVTFPKFTFCSRPMRYIKTWEKIIKETGKTEYCNATMLDLLSFNMTLEKIWISTKTVRAMTTEKLHEFARHVGSEPVSEDSFNYTNARDGDCLTIDIGSHEFTGTSTLYMMVVPMQYELICRRAYRLTSAYIHRRDMPIDLRSYVNVIPKGTAAIMFTEKELKYYNSLKNPCVHNDQHCYSECLSKKLVGQLDCRLPYMSLKLPLCKNTKSAKLAQKVYTTAALNLESCSCVRACNKTIYFPNLYFEPMTNFLTLYSIFFLHNAVEQIIEISSYYGIQLFCDIGSILGLTLGLCIPTIFEGILNIASNLKNFCK